jgi:hypothetical protein
MILRGRLRRDDPFKTTPGKLAAVIAPRTNGLKPNSRPNTAPAKNTRAGAIHFELIIVLSSRLDRSYENVGSCMAVPRAFTN